MSERDMEDYLTEALFEHAVAQGDPEPEVQTFADAQLLTGNRGLVVRIGGAEFQLTIMRAR
jgi:hypothetical protein